jgi:hypothetical protein
MGKAPKPHPAPAGDEIVERDEPTSTLLDSILEAGPGRRWAHETKAGYRVELSDEGGTEGLRIVAPGGHLCLKISLEASGPRIDVYGAELHAHAEDVVRLEGRRVEISGKDAVTLKSEGTITSEAFEHHLESTHGEVRLVANDDVALDGERIRLNSPPQVRPGHLRTPRPRERPGEDEGEP